MLRDVFPYLLDEGEYIESATIWESSRICAVAVDGQPQRSRNGVNFVLSELIAGIGEVAIIAGLTQIVSVFDARIYRVLKAVGCNPQLIGRPRRIGGTMSYAGLFDTGEGLLQALQAFREELGIEAPEAKELAIRVAELLTASPTARGHSPDVARSRRRRWLVGAQLDSQRPGRAVPWRAQAPISIRRSVSVEHMNVLRRRGQCYRFAGSRRPPAADFGDHHLVVGAPHMRV